jgi:hypothetical protein
VNKPSPLRLRQRCPPRFNRLGASTQQPKHIDGADLFIDLDQYAGKPVVLTDCTIYGAGNDGAILNCHSTYFKVTTDGIDRESFRFFLKNCTGLSEAQCQMPFLVTPTGKKSLIGPSLKDVKIAR